MALKNELVSMITRKYLLRGYILGVLTHTTALDRLWGGDETLKCGKVIYCTGTLIVWFIESELALLVALQGESSWKGGGGEDQTSIQKMVFPFTSRFKKDKKS